MRETNHAVIVDAIRIPIGRRKEYIPIQDQNIY